MSPRLPDPIESELIQLLDGPEADFWPGVARLCQRHAERSKDIQREAERLQAAAQGKRLAGSTEAKPPPRDEDAELKQGDRVGQFTVLEEIGHGGMGDVYLAEQREPVRRRVALKVIRLGLDTKAMLARFESERQALAMMDHSHIAKVFEAGATPKGRPYFAMEYVKGVPITRYCDENKLSLEDRLALFKQVCSGVQHAHTKGVIHRDLTPNNVLVTLQDGKPAAKIIDFGLARATGQRLTDRTLVTKLGDIVGTPEYMSPEQAGLKALDVDMRSDIYTLGVLLYELLTGRLPFEGRELRAQGYDAMCKTIREVEPPRPSTKVTTHKGGTDGAAKLRRTDASTLLRRLRGDLDWIVLKCLEKDRTRRYATVTHLADDVDRYLASEPVLARAPSAAYRLARFARRYRGQLVAASVVLVSLVGALVFSISFWLGYKAQAAEATRQADLAETARAGEAAKTKEAAESARLLRDKVAEFDQLAGVVHLERLQAALDELAAPWQDLTAAQRWLADADRLLAVRPDLEKTVADLRKRALPPTPEDLARDRAAHPRRAEYEALRARLVKLERAVAMLGGEALALPTLTSEEEALPLGLRRRIDAGERKAVVRELGDVVTRVRAELAVLEKLLDERHTYRFEAEAQGFLHNALTGLLAKLAAFETAKRAHVDTRLRCAELTMSHPKARATWQLAAEAIAKADGVVASGLCKAHPIKLRRQLGLVPIGMNPQTKLWEFYELRSAWDPATVPDPAALEIPKHDAEGRLAVGDDTGIVFVLLPGGTFTMGAQNESKDKPNFDPDAEPNERPRQVTLTPFFLARHELTQGQWNRLGGKRDQRLFKTGGTYPIADVDWFTSDSLLRARGLTLPNEAQWEYGCRATTTTPWWTGADAASLGDELKALRPVGTGRSNAFGLFEMHGNVKEWCGDQGDSSQIRVTRGVLFGFNCDPRHARSAFRGDDAPAWRNDDLGARPARAIQD